MPMDTPLSSEADPTGIGDRETVQSLSRGLAVIRAFGRDAPRMTLTEVAERTGMSRAAARRFLLTLVQEGYATTDGKHFALSPRVLDLGFAFLSSMDIWDVAQPIMQEVVRRTGESCSASVLDGAEVVYVARVPASRIMTLGLSVGSRLPAFATSMGRVLLAALPPAGLDAFFAKTALTPLTGHTVFDEAALRTLLDGVRTAGYALVDEELEAGLRSIAVPVRNRQGQVMAAMNVSCHAVRTSIRQMTDDILPALLDGAAAISRAVAR